MRAALCIFLSVLFSFISVSVAETRTVSIAATQSSWLDTGIILDGRKAVKVTATGTINYCGGSSQCNATADGSSESHCGGGSTSAPGAACGALIARVGGVQGVSFVLGTGVTIPKSRRGRLEIGIQDFLFEDNSGSFSVKFTGVSKEKHDLSGYVRGSDGGPFPRELVYARGRSKTYSTRTKSDGRYQFSDLPEGTYTITVERTMKFPQTFSPLDSEPLNFAFTPRRMQVSLTDDMSNQNFTARQFSTVKAPYRKVRRYIPNQLCTLSPAQDSGAVAQVRGIEVGTRLRMSDSFFASGFIVTVKGDGPFKSSRFSVSTLQCEGRFDDVAGIGLPLNSGGAEDGGSAVVELAPKS